MRLTTILLIFLITSISSQAQKIKHTFQSGKSFTQCFYIVVDSPENNYFISLEMHHDSIKYENIYDPKYLRIDGDTVKGILSLLKYNNEQQERIKNVYRELEYANDILSNMKTDGYVTNWKEFRKAVDVYMKFKAYKSVMKKP